MISNRLLLLRGHPDIESVGSVQNTVNDVVDAAPKCTLHVDRDGPGLEGGRTLRCDRQLSCGLEGQSTVVNEGCDHCRHDAEGSTDR